MRVIEQVYMVITWYQVTEPYTDQAYQKSPVVQLVEQLLYILL